MVDELVMHPSNAVPDDRGLSQVERVIDTFIAPSKTFADVRRNASWWLPFLLMALFTTASTFVVQHQVGFDRVNENQVRESPRREEALNQLTPEAKAASMAKGAKVTGVISYSIPLFLLITFAVYALLLWASFNFGLAAQTTYSQALAVSFYAALPYLLINVLTIVTLYFGGNAEAYNYKNPVGTNLGYYMAQDSAPWLKSLLGSIDLVKLWSVVLTTIGMSSVARKTILQSAAIVGSLWILGVLVGIAGASFS